MKRTRKYERAIWEKGAVAEKFSFRFIFLFLLSQFRGPDYLGAWNRLQRRTHEQRVIRGKDIPLAVYDNHVPQGS